MPCLGFFSRFPEGLCDVSHYPDLFAELARRGWTDEEMKKVAGLNLIRVFKTVEVVSYEIVCYFLGGAS